MTATPKDVSLATQFLDFCPMLAGKSLFFSFSLTVGNNFSFSVESRGKAALSSPTKKKKTPSTVRRNAKRREEFLRKKLAPTAEKSEQEVSEEETDSPGKAPTVLHHHPSPSPSSGRRKVTTVGREKQVPTFSQLDGAPRYAPPAARKEMTSRCEFCSLEEWEIGRLVIPEICHYSKVTCPICSSKASDIGVCDQCNFGFDTIDRKHEGYPSLKCRSCQSTSSLSMY